MSSAALDQSYRYAQPSALDEGAGRLSLVTTAPTEGGPEHFFTGRLANPERTAKQLMALMAIVRARFHMQQLQLLSDPIVTCGDERLRFEGFSGCAGAYARVDLDPAAVEGERFGRGTTNVDFNPPMLAALGKLRADSAVELSVGAGEVQLDTGEEAVVEKKVRLPLRWLKSLVEVQAVQANMQAVFTLPAVQASRFLRGLPRGKSGQAWVVPSGRGLRLSQVKPRGPGVKVGGVHRLRVLERMVMQAKELKIYAEPKTGASAWQLSFADSRFTLLISPEVWRGLSGEGQALSELTGAEGKEAIGRVRAQLGWASVIEPAALAARAKVDPAACEQALAVLGARGLVGYDLDSGAYFHRELPFDLELVDKLQPRLKAAKKLLAAGAVRIEGRQPVIAFVKSGEVEHRVQLLDEGSKCTCPWYAKHKGERGPCKHVLAVQLSLAEED